MKKASINFEQLIASVKALEIQESLLRGSLRFKMESVDYSKIYTDILRVRQIKNYLTLTMKGMIDGIQTQRA